MYESYAIECISPRTVDRAYPLAKAVAPSLQQLEWRQFCQACGLSNIPCDADERERIVVALNAKAYVKGLCIYAVRHDPTEGRVLDVPFFVIGSAADRMGVGAALMNFLRSKCSRSACLGIRFWAMNAETWTSRLRGENIACRDHGLFIPALASETEIEKALCASAIEGAETIDRFSR
ncbi:hypothetical protein [Methylovirgula sp. 4M-Z18]|uniref:hypothetical protein n=1 Tax=Methylovirgula sp. 4M-Z18 TaxID=2293567 RepID=UPI000E2F0CFF|nr:hypothetical protein [Methylovirgula sp. 4M-Z18]RFB79901.1 hypothetical protein DYH55_10695 [Methylovirgula sp. 4M-Z18]